MRGWARRFANRREAGRLLGANLAHLAPEQPVVVGLPRGGMPVAYEVAQTLGAPLDVLVVRKLGCPWQPVLGIGALGEGGIRLLNDSLMRLTGVTEPQLDAVAGREGAELQRRVQRYRGEREPIAVAGRTVIVVDDGLATGFTARAGIEVLRRRGAHRIVLAVPVAPRGAVTELRTVADEHRLVGIISEADLARQPPTGLPSSRHACTRPAHRQRNASAYTGFG